MKIKKYEASTEKEAMMKVKDDLGKEALIVSVKNIKPKGIYKIFKKPYVEVTAAFDEVVKTEKENEELTTPFQSPNIQMKQEETDVESFVQLIKSLQDAKEPVEQFSAEPQDTYDDEIDQDGVDLPILKVIYEQLLESEVDEIYINELMQGLPELVRDGGTDFDGVVSVVYKRIVKMLSQAEPIKLTKGKAKTVAFIGPTGVGKTTTIAKIASYFTLNMKIRVALITADTYRIAAVEQLRTYANILNIPIKVVYSNDELKHAIDSFQDYDLILLDTAGRSHKNEEQQNELSQLLSEIEDKEVFLVLSLGTKYKDLVKITNVYKDISDYKLIFTKLDETSSYGNVLNIKLKTGANLSYVTFGQNVPDDISEANVHEISKKILGGCE